VPPKTGQIHRVEQKEWVELVRRLSKEPGGAESANKESAFRPRAARRGREQLRECLILPVLCDARFAFS
jgi:hypothetical protein